MFIILLKFSENKSKAGDYMQAHNDWIRKGFEEGVFLVIGSIEPGQGGSVIAHSTSLEELEARVKADPFVSEGVVTSEIIEISPKKVDEKLGFFVQ